MYLLLLRARTAMRSVPGNLLKRCSAEMQWTAIVMDMAHGAHRHPAPSPLAKVDRLVHDVWHSTPVGHLDSPNGPAAGVVHEFF